MKGVLVSEEIIPTISEEAHSFFTLYGSVPVLVIYSDRTVTLYHAANGSLVKQLSVAERIEYVACCTFINYGSCVAILLNSSCVIWSESEQLYSVPLPCRMSSLHPLSNGLLFERVDDLGSMNVSFTITSATTSIPVYYSLSSPISIPKPVYQPQDGVVLPDVSNASVSELSHIVDLSMNFSIVDLFNSRVDVSRFDRDVVIVSSIPQYHLLVTYNCNNKEHQLIQLCDVHSKHVGVTSRTELMLRELHQSDVSMKDHVFESLNSPDLCMITLFSGALQDEPCSSVTVIPSFFDTSSFIIYFATPRTLHCYTLTGFSNDDEALSTAGVSLISVLEGEFVGEWNDSSFCCVVRMYGQWFLTVMPSINHPSNYQKTSRFLPTACTVVFSLPTTPSHTCCNTSLLTLNSPNPLIVFSHSFRSFPTPPSPLCLLYPLSTMSLRHSTRSSPWQPFTRAVFFSTAAGLRETARKCTYCVA